MNIVLYCSVCGHAFTVESKGSNSVCEYAYIVPCEVCAAQHSVQADDCPSCAGSGKKEVGGMLLTCLACDGTGNRR